MSPQPHLLLCVQVLVCSLVKLTDVLGRGEEVLPHIQLQVQAQQWLKCHPRLLHAETHHQACAVLLTDHTASPRYARLAALNCSDPAACMDTSLVDLAPCALPARPRLCCPTLRGLLLVKCGTCGCVCWACCRDVLGACACLTAALADASAHRVTSRIPDWSLKVVLTSIWAQAWALAGVEQ